jgi:DNA repair exonuclease SbcCD ATPase subunit
VEKSAFGQRQRKEFVNLMDNNEVLAEPVVTEAATPVMESVSLPVEEPNLNFSQDDIVRAREQEKAKLYPQLEKLKEELATLKKERDERAAEEERQRQLAAAEQQKKLEEDMDVRTLLQKKEPEFQQQLEAERLERERAFALLEQERTFQELMQYRQQRLESERDNIIPELIDLIEGNNRDEIEQSIASLKDKSARILDSAAQAMAGARREMTGARITAPASGPLDNDSEQRSYSPENIREMSLADYAKNRAKLLGEASNNRGRGLFG